MSSFKYFSINNFYFDNYRTISTTKKCIQNIHNFKIKSTWKCPSSPKLAFSIESLQITHSLRLKFAKKLPNDRIKEKSVPEMGTHQVPIYKSTHVLFAYVNSTDDDTQRFCTWFFLLTFRLYRAMCVNDSRQED